MNSIFFYILFFASFNISAKQISIADQIKNCKTIGVFTTCKTEFAAKCEFLLFNSKDLKKIISYNAGPKFSFLALYNGNKCENIWVSDECKIGSAPCDKDQLKLTK